MTRYNERFIYIIQDFTDVLASNVIKHLFDFDSKGHSDIVLIINSEGGEVASLFAIHDTIQLIESDVATICMGRAYSSAACLLISGAKGKRFITPNSELMFHEISSEIGGKLSIMKDELMSVEHCNHTMKKMVEKYLGLTYNKVVKKRGEAYYNAEQALKIGAVDHIVESLNDIFKYTNINL